jgi:hypothetical protein
MSVRYAQSGNNRVEHNRIVSGMSNFCFRGNSPLSEYLTENKTQKYLIVKLRKKLVGDVERVINEERVFVHKKEKLRSFKLYYVLCSIIEGCDYETLKEAKNLIDVDWVKGVNYLLKTI